MKILDYSGLSYLWSKISSTFATKTEVDGKQDTLTFDTYPTSGSTNPVRSNGIYTELTTKLDRSLRLTLSEVQSIFDNELFMVNENVYQMESGMTWEDFVNSDYNYTASVISSNKVMIDAMNAVGLNGIYVLPTDEIISDTIYEAIHVGGGSND